MKGKKLSVALAATFIAALGMSACSNVTPKDGKMITLNGYNGNPISIDASTIYDKFKKGDDGVGSYYKAILEVLIRDYFESSKDPSVKAKLVELRDKANKKVDGVRETASSNANKNGTNYKDEMEKLLEETYNVEDETQLFEYFLYQLEEDEAKDNYFKNQLGSLTNEYIGFEKQSDKWVEVDGKHSSTLPYHIKHILVKTSAEATDFNTSKISSEEAQKLATVFFELSSGKNTFGDVAKIRSDDGSASSYGDAGIMNTAQTFVNEFKLGTFAFDAIYGNTGSNNLWKYNEGGQLVAASKTDYFGLNEQYRHGTGTVASVFSSLGLNEVPFEVFYRLNEEKDTVTSSKGLSVNDGQEKYYPRNIYWNYYLNDHKPFIITSDTIPGEGGVSAPIILTEIGKAGFRKVKINGVEKTVLTDELGRIIFCVRSEYGIHFMVTQRTPFETEGTVVGYDHSKLTYKYNKVAINDYYTTYTPSDDKYPTEDGNKAVTYVNWFNTNQTTMLERANTVKDAVKGFDSMYDYRIFEKLTENTSIKIADEDVKNEINTYINNKRIYNEYSTKEDVINTWTSYLDLLLSQKTNRDITWKDTKLGADMHRYVNLTCARHFKDYDPDGALWKVGGACYYAK